MNKIKVTTIGIITFLVVRPIPALSNPEKLLSASLKRSQPKAVGTKNQEAARIRGEQFSGLINRLNYTYQSSKNPQTPIPWRILQLGS